MPVVRRLLLAGAVTAVAVGAGIVVLGDDGTRREEPTSASMPLTSFDTSQVTILRTGFCDRVADAAVNQALQTPPRRDVSYGNGDRVRLTPGVRDRAHEYGCSWSAGGTTAEAWVFAPPVTRATAGDLLRRARATRACEPIPDAPVYGDPSAGLVCTTGSSKEVSFRGLFGDAWLVCSLSSDDVSAGQAPEAAIDRAGRWCVSVARAAQAPEDTG
jgi:pyruvate/2-oxoglutarate dehydrogenase complex dihydrolipoamide acyltransferase (E2) component